jgi:hypothetical protein
MPLLLVHPLHETKLSIPDVAGAVSVTATPELYVRTKLVLPLPAPLMSAGLTWIATPLLGLTEFTVSAYVVGGGGVDTVPPSCFPQPVASSANAAATHTALLIPMAPMSYIPRQSTIHPASSTAALA